MSVTEQQVDNIAFLAGAISDLAWSLRVLSHHLSKAEPLAKLKWGEAMQSPSMEEDVTMLGALLAHVKGVEKDLAVDMAVLFCFRQ